MDQNDQADPWEQFSGVLAESIGLDSPIDPDQSYGNIGGNSLNAVAAVLSLRQAGFDISIDEFLGAKRLGDLLRVLDQPQNGDGTLTLYDRYTIGSLKEANAREAQLMIARSFLKHDDLLKSHNYTNVEEYAALLDAVWDLMLPHSVVVFDREGRLRGVGLALDEFAGAKEILGQIIASQDPSCAIARILAYVDTFTQPVENELNPKHLPGVIFMKFMLAASIDINTPEENVEVFYILKRELKQKAEELGFKWTLAQNASPLTRQLAEYMGCKRFSTSYPYEFVAEDGSRPFKTVPESYNITIDAVPLNMSHRAMSTLSLSN